MSKVKFLFITLGELMLIFIAWFTSFLTYFGKNEAHQSSFSISWVYSAMVACFALFGVGVIFCLPLAFLNITNKERCRKFILFPNYFFVMGFGLAIVGAIFFS